MKIYNTAAVRISLMFKIIINIIRMDKMDLNGIKMVLNGIQRQLRTSSKFTRRRSPSIVGRWLGSSAQILQMVHV